MTGTKGEWDLSADASVVPLDRYQGWDLSADAIMVLAEVNYARSQGGKHL